MNFLTDPFEGMSTLRPANILVFGWTVGKTRLCGPYSVSPLSELKNNGFIAGQIALKAELGEVGKHEKMFFFSFITHKLHICFSFSFSFTSS